MGRSVERATWHEMQFYYVRGRPHSPAPPKMRVGVELIITEPGRIASSNSMHIEAHRTMKLIPEIQAAHGEIQTLRRTIHAHPELRYEETQTSDLVAKSLTEWGIEVHRGLGKTGVVGVLKRG